MNKSRIGPTIDGWFSTSAENRCIDRLQLSSVEFQMAKFLSLTYGEHANRIVINVEQIVRVEQIDDGRAYFFLSDGYSIIADQPYSDVINSLDKVRPG